MIFQLKDCVDCLKVLFNDQYQFLFLFNHSCGHGKKRQDGLNIENMLKSYGGKQPAMRQMAIKQLVSFATS